MNVRRAIHIRTGQSASIAAVDTWLTRHELEVARFDDVYSACVHLLTNYERIADLALVGADWLADDEFNIITYIRQTWPRTAIIVYGASDKTPIYDVLPLMRTVRRQAALDELVAQNPADVVTELARRAVRSDAPTIVPATPAAQPEAGSITDSARAAVEAENRNSDSTSHDTRESRPEQSPSDNGGIAPRSILSAEELSALLDGTDHG